MNQAENSDAFDTVIAALTVQRDRIDATIETLLQLKASGFVSAAAAFTVAESLQTPMSEIKNPDDKLGPGAFLGMSIVDAAKKLLTHERRQLTNAEIVEAFKRGGLILNSAEPMNTVGSVLNRRFGQVGDVVRVGRGTWGLKEWYPNRSFKPTAKSSEPRDGSAQTPFGVITPEPGPYIEQAAISAPDKDEMIG